MLGLRSEGFKCAVKRQHSKAIALVVPIYKETLSEEDEERLLFSLRNWSEDIVFFGPRGLSTSYYQQIAPTATYEEFGSDNFQSVSSYSRFLRTSQLYDRLRKYTFILICQTDAILLKGISSWDVDKFRFDYLGAGWFPGHRISWHPLKMRLGHGVFRKTRRLLRVGNGGLSLRRVSAFRIATRLLPRGVDENEDILFSYFAPLIGLRVAPLDVAERFFSEGSSASWQAGTSVPDVHGFHALRRFNPRLEEQILRPRG